MPESTETGPGLMRALALVWLALFATCEAALASEDATATPAPFALLEPLIGVWDVGP